MSGLKFNLSEVISLLPDNLSGFKEKIYMWHSIFSISFTGSRFHENLKNDHTFNNKLLIILKTMFIIDVVDLSTKNKM